MDPAVSILYPDFRRPSPFLMFQQARSGDQLAALGGYTRDDEVAWHDTKASDSESADSVR